mgnify:CR=1 FL=1
MSRISDFIGKSAVENVKEALQRARDVENYHALLSLTEERALERAAKVDQGEISGRLAGVPFVVKDNFLAFGAPTTAAARMLENFNAPLQATAVEKLEAEVDSAVVFDEVLAVGGEGDLKVGTPVVSGAKVTGKVVAQGKEKKILVFKYKAKSNYRRRQGHRQPFTKVVIEKIEA